jgi:hypothetical protein
MGVIKVYSKVTQYSKPYLIDFNDYSIGTKCKLAPRLDRAMWWQNT